MHTKVLERLLQRQVNAHKYDFGHVLVVGGSPGMVGAPFLVASAALRTGAGLVTIASTADVIDKLEKRVEEIMTFRIYANVSEAVENLSIFLQERKVSVIVLGPGLTSESAGLSTELLQRLVIPVIADAGAFFAFHGKLALLSQVGNKNNNLILTPHAGEYAKLTDSKPPESIAQLKQTVSRFAKTHNVTLVFKGHHTLVAHRDGRVYQNTTGNPGMATAGSGDVLSGVLSGLLAQGLTTSEATEAGVYLHGLAGDLAVQAKTQPGMIASDIIDCIPAVFNISKGPSYN